MTLSYSRRLASQLLRAALSIAPHDTLDWGQGMLSELNHVEGNWSALLWAFGGAGVLAKHAVLAAVFSVSNRPVLPSGGDLFEKESPMRKTVLAAIAACVAASLLFFLAPVFRQAFQVSLAQWHDILHVHDELGYDDPTPQLLALAKQAEQNHDAQALAFVAVRHPIASESARLAEEAVRMDPKLTWVYATVAVQHPAVPEIDRWVMELEKYDPGNALPYLLVAEKTDLAQVDARRIPRTVEDESAAWQDAMAAAFQSQKLDTYLARLTQLERSVLFRYQVHDPFQAVTDHWMFGLPTYGAWDSSLHAKSLIESGRALEAKGDLKGAAEKYLAVAKFGQLLELDGGYFFLGRDTQEAYRGLGALSAKKGDNAEASFYVSLAEQTEKAEQSELASRRSRYLDADVSRWNALITRVSGLALLFCAALLSICALGVFLRGRALKLSSLRTSSLTLAVGLGSAVGILISSAMLYVSYRPYSQIIQRYIASGDKGQLPELSQFLADTQLPIGSQSYQDPWHFVFYFWFAVVALCVLTLLLVVFWRLRHPPRPTATAV
jgi:hypothetical protein